MSFNLYSVLSEQDKEILNDYITTYGISKKYFMGLENWLSSWGKNKIGLYHLLGDKLIYSIPFEHIMPQGELEDQFDRLIWGEEYGTFFSELRRSIWAADIENDDEIVKAICNYRTYAKNELSEEVILDFLPNKKKVVLSKGMKPVKALHKYLKYIATEEDEKKLMERYEEFRLSHSRVLNTKKIVGKLCFSIHPMDFITMSDNSYNWTSCMNWTDPSGGCYKVGSTEMMFSNCVVCCYLKTKEPFNFGKNGYSWNNKKWRQLFYVTKDIIVSGKSYPYKSDEISSICLTTLRELAEKNKGWKYQFGPEEYLDMKTIYGEEGFYKCREENFFNRRNDYTNEKREYKSHRILFETRGMYNDMVNDHSRTYNCVRNKVNYNKIINISGKSKCLHCGKEVVYEEDCYDDYNDIYENCGSLICTSCKDNIFSCYKCGEFIPPTQPTYILDGKQYCPECINGLRICPSTKSILNIYDMVYSTSSRADSVVFAYVPTENGKYEEINLTRAGCNYYLPAEELIKEYGFVPMFMDKDYLKEKINTGEVQLISKTSMNFIKKQLRFPWESEYNYYVWTKPIDLNDEYMTRHFYTNLEPVSYEKLEN